MTETEILERMADRLLAAQTPWGRARLNFYVKWKRLAWNFVTSFAHFIKRIFDILISIIAIFCLAPVFLGIAIAVKLDGGPIFFRQTRYGLHVVALDRQIEGVALPFEMVRERIATWLNEKVRRQAIKQYIAILAGRAEIVGIDLAASATPLVQ